MLTAIQEDRSIVTHNVKDFIPILAFEKAIWNPVSDKIYRLSPEDEKALKSDEALQRWVERILDAFGQHVEEQQEADIIDSLHKTDDYDESE